MNDSNEDFKGKDSSKFGDKDESVFHFYHRLDKFPKDTNEFEKVIEWLQNDIVEGLSKEMGTLFGISPIQQSRNEIERLLLFGDPSAEKPKGLINSSIADSISVCICCRHWKIEEGKIYLVGICQRTMYSISYDKNCDKWEKI